MLFKFNCFTFKNLLCKRLLILPGHDGIWLIVLFLNYCFTLLLWSWLHRAMQGWWQAQSGKCDIDKSGSAISKGGNVNPRKMRQKWQKMMQVRWTLSAFQSSLPNFSIIVSVTFVFFFMTVASCTAAPSHDCRTWNFKLFPDSGAFTCPAWYCERKNRHLKEK